MSLIFNKQYDDHGKAESTELYIGEDGLPHCAKCHEAKIMQIELGGKVFDMPIPCKCEEELERKREEERRRKTAPSRTSRKAPENIELPGWRIDFEGLCTDDPPYDKLNKYIEMFPDASKRFGLLLFGPPSCGKSYAASYLASKIEEKGFSILVTSPTRVLNELQDLRSKNRNKLIDSICRFDLIVLDDLGSQRSTDFTREQMFMLVDAIYRSRATLVVTTNLSLKEFASPDSIDTQRIFERIRHRCRAVSFPARNWRLELAEKEQA